MNKAPVIISGMHRSGTSLFTSLLLESGLMIGKELDQNYESIYFYSINEDLLELNESSWDKPRSFAHYSDELLEKYTKFANAKMKSKSSKRYLGWIKWILTNSDITAHKKPWGWKDPRNTITWPVWKAIFPEAKFIHIVRNPIDVATSLCKREVQKKRMVSVGTVNVKKYSERVQNLESAIQLWNEYEDEADKMLHACKPNVHIVKYESLLHDSHKTMKKVIEFLNEKKLSIQTIDFRAIDTSRANAYKKDESFNKELIKTISARHMERLNYSYTLI